MAFLLNWIWPQPKAPESVPTDTVIPLHSRDDVPANRSIALDFTMRFDEVLDADKLAGALCTLLEKPGWKRLGARLRLNNKGKLEYHVPERYTKDRRAVNFTCARYDMALSEHPIGRQLPSPDGTLRTFTVEKSVCSLTTPDDSTCAMADWIYSDKAQLSLHVVTFSDATLVTLTWLHSLLDAMGRRALLHAWMAVLDDRHEDVPEFWGYDFDPLEKIGMVRQSGVAMDSEPSKEEKHMQEEELVLKDRCLNGFQTFIFIFKLVWITLFQPPPQSRLIIMPASYYAKIKAQVLRDLATAPPDLLTYSTKDPSKPFVSDGDILTAWLTRLSATSSPSILASRPSRTITVMNVFGMREILSKTCPQLLPPGKAYVGNCVSVIYSLFTAADFFALPLGHIAARLRRDLTLQGTRPQLEAAGAFARSHRDQQPLYGASDMALRVMSNWEKGKFFDVDFSSAMVDDAHGAQQASAQNEKPTKRARPKAVFAYMHVSKWFPLRGATTVTGRDDEGNYWLGALIDKDQEDMFDKVMEGMK